MSHASTLPRRMQQLLGTVLAERYRVDALIGSGASGAVFSGYHLTLRRPIAIKVLHPSLSLHPESAKRFDREARVASGLQHPNCCPVIDYGTSSNGCKYMIMPLLQGRDLAGLMGEPMSPARATAYVIQVLRGLKHAHDQGVVHRDLKPENLILTKDSDGSELVRITDFGIAKIIRGDGAAEAVTRVGTVPGTPEYMSPEHAKGLAIDERSDLYAVGLIFYELVAGHPAFSDENPLSLMRKQVYEKVPALPSFVPETVAAIVHELLAKDPNERFFDARGVLQVLRPVYRQLLQTEVRVTEAATRRRRSWLHGLWAWLRPSPPPSDAVAADHA